MTPYIIPRSEHPISRKRIDEEALKVLYRLRRFGFLAYLVGGSVRDLLLGKTPKDFDVATNAHPYQINALFKNSRIIGRRFRLAHVFFKGGKTIEVSTFRSHSEYEDVENEEGEIVRRESFGTPEEDALRRDITINGLFYNIADFSIIDYVGGMRDLERKTIQTIGDPDEKFKEDPVRMTRVLRHAARTRFSIEDQTWRAIFRHREKMRNCSPSRIRDEFLRDLREGSAASSLHLMLQAGILLSIFPDLQRVFGDRSSSKEKNGRFLLSLFSLADQLINIGKPLSEPMLLALFVAPYLQAVIPEHPSLGKREQYIYLVQTIRWTVHHLLTPYSFPRGIKETASQILIAQSILSKASQKGMILRKLRGKTYFQEAALFFGIKAHAKGELVPHALRHAIPFDRLPWWPKGFESEIPKGRTSGKDHPVGRKFGQFYRKRRRRISGKRSPLPQ